MEAEASGIKRVVIGQASDITVVCQYGRALAVQLGLSPIAQTAVVTAIKEMGYNILKYAGQGQMILMITVQNNLHGLMVIAQDQGPGIADIEQAMQEGYSTGDGLGLGLPGARRLMDEFEIDSKVGQGTTVVMKKWLR
jgi:serine/threonine-protein kinase RsbT